MSVAFLGSKLGNPVELRRAGTLLIGKVTGLWTSGSSPDDRKLADFCQHWKGTLFVVTADVLDAAAKLDELRQCQFSPEKTAKYYDLRAAADNLIDGITHTLNAAVTYLHAAAQILNVAEQTAADRTKVVLCSSCLSRIERLEAQVRALLGSIDLMSVENVLIDFASNSIVA